MAVAARNEVDTAGGVGVDGAVEGRDRVVGAIAGVGGGARIVGVVAWKVGVAVANDGSNNAITATNASVAQA